MHMQARSAVAAEQSGIGRRQRLGTQCACVGGWWCHTVVGHRACTWSTPLYREKQNERRGSDMLSERRGKAPTPEGVQWVGSPA